VTTPKLNGPTTGVRAFGRFALFALFCLAFIALAISTVVLDGPWTVVIAYLACAVVLGLLAQKVFPRRQNAPLPAGKRSPSTRSGNPAIRAAGDDPREGDTTRR
jgi:hypothetical protein